MNNTRYTIRNLASDLRDICATFRDEHEILIRVRPLALRAALSKDAWLEKRFYEADSD